MIFQPKTTYELEQAIKKYCENDDQSNGNINDWDVSLITDMSKIFYCGCDNIFNCNKKIHKFNQPLDKWNVSNVTNMFCMFWKCHEFNQPLNNWNVSKVNNMRGMFCECLKFNQSLNDWNVSNVTETSWMFNNCKQFNQPLNKWNVSNVINMQYMFTDSVKFNQSLNNWNISNVIDMLFMFHGCKFNLNMQNFFINSIKKGNMVTFHEVLKHITIIKLYCLINDENLIKNIASFHQMNQINDYIKKSSIDICKSCYLETKCINNICVFCE